MNGTVADSSGSELIVASRRRYKQPRDATRGRYDSRSRSTEAERSLREESGSEEGRQSGGDLEEGQDLDTVGRSANGEERGGRRDG